MSSQPVLNLSLNQRKSLTSSSRLIISQDPKQSLYSCIKKIDDQLLKLKFFTSASKLYLNLSNPSINHTLLVPSTLSSQGHSKIISHLNIKGNFPYFTLKPWELIEKRMKKTNSLAVPVEFWYNGSLKVIKIQSNNFTKELKAADNVIKIGMMIDQLFDSIKVRNGEVVFEEFKETCLAQAAKCVNSEPYFIRVLREKSKGKTEFHSSYRSGWDLRFQFFNNSGDLTEAVYSLDEICEKFQTTPEKIDEKIPEILNKLDIKQKNICFSRHASNILKLVKVFECKKRILNTYHISFFQILEIPRSLLITAELNISSTDFYCVGVKFEENTPAQKVFSECFQQLTIRKGRLRLVKKDLDCYTYSAIQIQKAFRGYIQRTKYKLLKLSSNKPKIVHVSAKLFGNLGIKILIKQSNSGICVICSGDITTDLEFPNSSLLNSNYKLIVQSLYIKDGKVEINSNLLTVFQKNQKFSLPQFLNKHKKVLEKWKMVQGEYCRVSIYELNDSITVLIDTTYKVFTRSEILSIYHEVSYECIYEEVTLKNSGIFLDPSSRPEPVLILNRKYTENSYVSVILRDHIGKNLLKQQALIFEVSFSSIHHRVILNLDKAIEKTGIPKDFLVAISNYLVASALKVTRDSISLNLNIPPFDINRKVNTLQRVFRGFIVRKNIGKILVSNQNYLVAVKKQKINGMDFMLFAYVQGGKIRIEAMDKEYRLVLYLDHNLVQGFGDERKKVIEDVIFTNLFIDSSSKMKRLCIDTFILQKPQRKARKLSMKLDQKQMSRVTFAVDNIKGK